MVASLYGLLTNSLNVGKIKHKSDVYNGEHESIIDKARTRETIHPGNAGDSPHDHRLVGQRSKPRRNPHATTYLDADDIVAGLRYAVFCREGSDMVFRFSWGKH